jgi:hypothetical protein
MKTPAHVNFEGESRYNVQTFNRYLSNPRYPSEKEETF